MNFGGGGGKRGCDKNSVDGDGGDKERRVAFRFPTTYNNPPKREKKITNSKRKIKIDVRSCDTIC